MISLSPKISVVIPHYNSGKFFEDAFSSLLLQTEENWEAIIVDDGSEDGSLETVKSFVKNSPRFRLIENGVNAGCAAALHKAITFSSAPYFVRLDPDDSLSEDAIKRACSAVKEFPQAGLIYFNHFICNEDLEVQKTHYCRQISDITSEESFLYHKEISQFAIFKKEVYEKTGGVDCFNKRAEDTDIYLKMCEAAPVQYINETLYNYRIHPEGRRQYENAERAKFWYWFAAIKMQERRQLNLEDFFVKHCARRSELEMYIQRDARVKKMIQRNPLLYGAVKISTKLGWFEGEKYLNP